MSDLSYGRARWLILLALVGMLAVVRVAAGQTVAEYSHRLDSLGQIWRAASAQQAHLDSVRVFYLPADTVRVGKFFILTDSEHVALARGAAERLAPIVDRAYGMAAERLERHTFVLRTRRSLNAGPVRNEIESGIVSESGELRFSSADIPDEQALANSWLGKIEFVMSDELGAEFHDWLGASIPSSPPNLRALNDARVDLVLAQSSAAQECAAGKLERCRQALGLTAVDDPAMTLFSAAERRGMIARDAAILRRADEKLYDRCAVARQQTACDSLVETIPTATIPPAVPASVKQFFVRYALAVGGPGAFDRLDTTTGRPRQRFEAAAGIPIDSLIRRWQSTVMSSRAGSTAMDGETAASAIFWAALCGALALRSSRWR